MRYWTVPSNAEKFILDELLKDHDIESRRGMNKFEVGDVVFIYTSAPMMRNCHAMLHKGKDSLVLTGDELKSVMKHGT